MFKFFIYYSRRLDSQQINYRIYLKLYNKTFFGFYQRVKKKSIFFKFLIFIQSSFSNGGTYNLKRALLKIQLYPVKYTTLYESIRKMFLISSIVLTRIFRGIYIKKKIFQFKVQFGWNADQPATIKDEKKTISPPLTSVIK